MELEGASVGGDVLADAAEEARRYPLSSGPNQQDGLSFGPLRIWRKHAGNGSMNMPDLVPFGEGERRRGRAR